MQPFNCAQDRCGTFLAIKAQAEGLAAITTCTAAAYEQIASAKFTGKGHYTFDQYIAHHKKAFNELETLRQPVPEDKKVGNFMSHIHDACLTTARDLIFCNPEYSNSFENTQQHCKGLLARNSIHAMHTGKDSCRVSKTQCKQGNNKKSDKTGGKHVHAGHYSPQEYCALALEEKAQVKALCEQAKKRKTLGITVNDDDNGGDTWEDSSVSTSDVTIVTNNKVKNASEQFGCAAHSN